MKRIDLTEEEVNEFGKMDDRITARINQLQDYCHGKKCKKDHWICPEKCGCNKHLGLDTAIAWELADKIINDVPQCGESPDLSREEEFVEMRDLRYAVIGFLHAVEYHMDKYKKLYELLEATVCDLYEYQRKIDNCLKKGRKSVSKK
jgi:hypothetical protein